MLSDKVRGRGTNIPPQVKPPRSPRQWKTICTVIGAIIALIPATNEELQRLLGVPPGVAFPLGLVTGAFLGAAVGRAIDKRNEHKRFLASRPELQKRHE
jgi:hypothetical protein